MVTWREIVGKSFVPDVFGAYTQMCAGSMNFKPQFVVLHNTATPTLARWHDAPGEVRMKNLEHYYRDIQGWSAGPHLFVADDRIWTFTPLWVPGVHSPSWNRISWGVETVGDYATEQVLPAVQENLLRALLALHQLGGLDPRTLRLHKEDPRTTHDCPGKHLADLKPYLIGELQVRLSEVHT